LSRCGGLACLGGFAGFGGFASFSGLAGLAGLVLNVAIGGIRFAGFSDRTGITISGLAPTGFPIAPRPFPCAMMVALPINAKFAITTSTTKARFSVFLYDLIPNPFWRAAKTKDFFESCFELATIIPSDQQSQKNHRVFS
jgi:hypothetical protein